MDGSTVVAVVDGVEMVVAEAAVSLVGAAVPGDDEGVLVDVGEPFEAADCGVLDEHAATRLSAHIRPEIADVLRIRLGDDRIVLD